jgi:hypothetical protein
LKTSADVVPYVNPEKLPQTPASGHIVRPGEGIDTRSPKPVTDQVARNNELLAGELHPERDVALPQEGLAREMAVKDVIARQADENAAVLKPQTVPVQTPSGLDTFMDWTTSPMWRGAPSWVNPIKAAGTGAGLYLLYRLLKDKKPQTKTAGMPKVRPTAPKPRLGSRPAAKPAPAAPAAPAPAAPAAPAAAAKPSWLTGRGAAAAGGAVVGAGGLGAAQAYDRYDDRKTQEKIDQAVKAKMEGTAVERTAAGAKDMAGNAWNWANSPIVEGAPSWATPLTAGGAGIGLYALYRLLKGKDEEKAQVA